MQQPRAATFPVARGQAGLMHRDGATGRADALPEVPQAGLMHRGGTRTSRVDALPLVPQATAHWGAPVEMLIATQASE